MSVNTKKRPTKKANGEGTIYFNESKSTWVGQIVLGSKEDGNPNRITRYGKTKKIVREKLKQAELEYHTGCLVDRSKITIKMLLEQYLKEKYDFNMIKESTYARNLDTLKYLNEIANIPIQQINVMQIKNYLASLVDKYSQSSIAKQYQLLKKAFYLAKKKKIITEDFFEDKEDLRMPKSKQKNEKVRALTTDEQKRLMDVLFEHPEYNYRNQMLLSLLRGMRMGEINALEVKDINFVFNVITIDKTVGRGKGYSAIINNQPKTLAGERKIHFSDVIKEILIESIGDKKEGLVFTTNGKIIRTTNVNQQFNLILQRYNIIDPNEKGKVTLHSLRHTYATRCIESGMPVKVLQEILGHKDISVTLNTYCDVFAKFEKEHLYNADNYIESLASEHKFESKNKRA